LTLRRVSRVIAVSRAVAESLRGRHIFNDEQIVVIHNGIDANRFGDLRARTEKLRVGMAGHLAPIKGQEDLIRAAAVICAERNDVEFIIAGEDKSPGGENRRFLERLIDKLNLQGRIQLVGWVDDMPRFLSSLDVFVSPARSEPFGLTIVEAMAGGVPVVATMSEGAQEIIDPDITGVMVPIADIKAIAAAIRPLLDDQNLASSLSQRARDIVREKFSLERMVDETENVYRSALGYSS
jgi:glycosyltransferase involved in cell wall biosynthesis